MAQVHHTGARSGLVRLLLGYFDRGRRLRQVTTVGFGAGKAANGRGLQVRDSFEGTGEGAAERPASAVVQHEGTAGLQGRTFG